MHRYTAKWHQWKASIGLALSALGIGLADTSVQAEEDEWLGIG